MNSSDCVSTAGSSRQETMSQETVNEIVQVTAYLFFFHIFHDPDQHTIQLAKSEASENNEHLYIYAFSISRNSAIPEFRLRHFDFLPKCSNLLREQFTPSILYPPFKHSLSRSRGARIFKKISYLLAQLFLG
jgi:hypothetical protein